MLRVTFSATRHARSHKECPLLESVYKISDTLLLLNVYQPVVTNTMDHNSKFNVNVTYHLTEFVPPFTLYLEVENHKAKTPNHTNHSETTGKPLPPKPKWKRPQTTVKILVSTMVHIYWHENTTNRYIYIYTCWFGAKFNSQCCISPPLQSVSFIIQVYDVELNCWKKCCQC